MAKLLSKPYEMIDAMAMHVANPDTFDMPDFRIIAALKPGFFVKIGVTYDPRRRIGDDAPQMQMWVAKVGEIARDTSGERFWLLLETISDGHYIGTVNNDLAYTAYHGLKFGDLLTVERRHIMDVLAP